MQEGTELLELEQDDERDGGTLGASIVSVAAMIGVQLIGAVIVAAGIAAAWALIASTFGPSAAALGRSLGLG
ncbi:hypothetical protein [Microbacterium sp. 13-71-7]|jgi:hypothetical protein|uniref:hypothetical protein n=1 Tax=Microbacterium sp. 13-71-7 TaxID=1970399 RepID=UPI000BCAFFEF|nr:hypothetical protein [Microbacterium sp. 13-71-7]OZB82364.1 MAG: hypothetical protein B7X32_13900 [Microbacterium sp. 13-71-7]